jgi:DNA polymerase I
VKLAAFREIVYIDFEFRAPTGDRPTPVCYVAMERYSGRVFKQWLDGNAIKKPPFAQGPDVLSVAFYASAEWSCYLQLGWKLPESVFDLYAEFRNLTNYGLPLPCGRGLLGALQYFGLPAIAGVEKDALRRRILAGGPYNAEERTAILDYCATDVYALQQLMPRMFGVATDVRPALLRGRYTKAVAHAEHNGVPVDAPLYTEFAARWTDLQHKIIDRANVPVYDGRTFKAARFADWIAHQDCSWPTLPSGALALDDDTFREMAARCPVVEPLRQVRQMLGQLRKPDLAVGADGRNRVLLSPFGTITGRNTPSNSRFIFGLPSWMRGLIRPEPGRALAYIDWSQQEFGIAAALSGDVAMQRAYESGDPYLEFARLAGAVRAGATKESNPVERRLFKTTVLGVQYQLGPTGLAYRLGIGLPEAETLLEHHRRVFSMFWRWSDAACDFAQLHGELQAVFGWTLRIGPGVKLRTMRNFPMQANGSEMLRLACCFATEADIQLAAPVHDALLIEAAVADIEHAAAQTQQVMRLASERVLAGFALRTDVQIIRHPNRFIDERGETMWRWLLESLSVSSSYSSSLYKGPLNGDLPLGPTHGHPPLNSKGNKQYATHF